jgi:predicted metal-dependent phosphoesterase TrpH
MALENDCRILSITDHDNIDAYSDELFDYAESRNMILIPGVEISTKIDKCGIHVLGYNFDINNEELRNKLKVLRNTRHDYLVKVAKKLEELGYKVNVEELDKIDSVTKSHIALDIIGNEENLDMLHKDFNHLPGKSEFIEALLIEGCPAYVKKEGITPKEAADLIRGAGGKVALAHPVCYKYEDGLTEDEILNIVKDMDANVIEATYLYVDRYGHRINEVDLWKNFAKDNNLLSSVGSDFHNIDDIHPLIGFKNWDVDFSKEEAVLLLNYLSN